MYGAMRERASGSTRIAGGVTALTIGTALGVAVVIGMGGHALIEKEEKLMFTVMPEQTVTPPPEPTERQFDTTAETTLTFVQPDINIFFEVEDPPIRAPRDPETRAMPGPAAPSETVIPTPPKPPGVRTAARIIPGAAPPYPAPDVRKGNEGVSELEVCLDARGRVTSAQLVKTSGSVSLDKAALEWVREAKFTPAKLDGAAQAVCGHSVDYEWKLDRR